jgi:peroxiredoxin
LKRIITCLLLLLPAALCAQQALHDGSSVRDSSGKLYSKEDWKALLRTGDYSLEPNTYLEDADFILYRMDADEKQLRKEGGKQSSASKFFITGSPIKHFILQDLQGKRYDSDSLKGKIIVLNFWYADCAPCIYELPELNALVQKYKHRNDVVFLAVTFEERSEVEKLLRKKPFTYTMIADALSYINELDLNLYPTHAVIDRSGNVRFHTSGYTKYTTGYLKKTINSLLREPYKPLP